METRFQWLADNPLLGRQRDEVALGYRSFRQGSHIVFYMIDADVIYIIGIPHASMDIESYFEEP